MTRTLWLTAIAALLVLLSLAAACGGGDDQATATPAPSDAPIATSTSEAAGEADLEIRIEGDFVAPDAHAFSNTVSFAGSSITREVVIIGDLAWLREGTADWEETTRGDPAVLAVIDLSSADPDFLLYQDFVSDLQTLDGEPDSINRVQTTRYFSRETMSTLVDPFGGGFLEGAEGLEDFEMTVWLEEVTDGLVRAELTAVGTVELLGDAAIDAAADAEIVISLIINLTQIAADILIEPPVATAAEPTLGGTESVFLTFHYTIDVTINVSE